MFLCIVPIVGVTFILNARLPDLSGGGGHSVLIWLWTFAFYLQKLFWPWTLVPLYDLPYPVSFLNPPYLGALATAGILAVVMIRFRRDRWLWFALGFYFLSIFFYCVLTPARTFLSWPTGLCICRAPVFSFGWGRKQEDFWNPPLSNTSKLAFPF